MSLEFSFLNWVLSAFKYVDFINKCPESIGHKLIVHCKVLNHEFSCEKQVCKGFEEFSLWGLTRSWLPTSVNLEHFVYLQSQT